MINRAIWIGGARVVAVMAAMGLLVGALGCGGGRAKADAGTDTGGGLVEFDLAVQFDDQVNGGSNPWSYGWMDMPGGTFTPFTIKGDGVGGAGTGLYAYKAVDPNVTVSGGQLVGWNGDEPQPALPVGTAWYPFILKNVGTTPFVLQSNSGAGSGITVQPGQIYAHPGPQHIVTARFTAPRALTGRTIRVQFDRLQISSTAFAQTVLLVVGGTTLSSKVLAGDSDSTSFLSPAMNVQAGDTVDFMVQPVPTFGGGSIAITGQISAGS